MKPTGTCRLVHDQNFYRGGGVARVGGRLEGGGDV